MHRKMSMGKFISLEGGEGSGKGEQIKRLHAYLSGKGFDVVQTREPGGVGISEQIRKVLLNPENKEMTPITEILLYEAARAQFTPQLVLPSLEAG